MDPKPLDLETQTAVAAALWWARTHGMDQVEHLNKLGLLLTSAQDKRIRLEAMQFTLSKIREWQPHEFMRRINDGAWTPTLMYNEIVKFIEECIEWWEREQ